MRGLTDIEKGDTVSQKLVQIGLNGSFYIFLTCIHRW